MVVMRKRKGSKKTNRGGKGEVESKGPQVKTEKSTSFAGKGRRRSIKFFTNFKLTVAQVGEALDTNVGKREGSVRAGW